MLTPPTPSPPPEKTLHHLKDGMHKEVAIAPKSRRTQRPHGRTAGCTEGRWGSRQGGRDRKAKAVKCYYLCHKITLKERRQVRKQDQIQGFPKAAL